jgi:hypothetical protein
MRDRPRTPGILMVWCSRMESEKLSTLYVWRVISFSVTWLICFGNLQPALVYMWVWCLSHITKQASMWRLVQWREMVSWPPKKMCSTATAEPALCQKEEICNNYLFTHQEYIRCHKPDNINLEIELADLPTTRLDHMHQNLPEEAWSTLQVHWLLAL